ncbi:hypothetical protein BDW74DRAFT_183429 [Aspergillus multicolor]|uniref:uncharacterized protein n=1 Tax=Aspergillus multicolor TaxID=41759 RepID=UPI003CCDC50F
MPLPSPSLLYRYLSVSQLSIVARANTANADQVDDGTDHNGPTDKTTRIIVGVVVGGVAAIAITAGIIFFFMKKRKWDRIRACEERLIDYQLATGYSSKMQSRSVTPEDYLGMMAQSPPATSTTVPSTAYVYDPSTPTRYSHSHSHGHGQADEHGQGQGIRPNSRARGMSAPASTTLSLSTSNVSPEAPPPAYQSLHPRYDPSRYSQISTRFSSSFEIPRSSTGTFGTANIPGPAISASSVSAFSGVQSYNPASASASASGLGVGAQYSAYQYQPGSVALGSGAGSGSAVPTTATGTATTVSAGSNGTSTRGSRSQSESGARGPRRPRPVLSRLITNL